MSAYSTMQFIAVLSTLPRLSYHLSCHLPKLTISDVLPGQNDTISKLEKAEIIIADFDLLIPYVDKLPLVKWVQGTWAGVDNLLPHLRDKNITYTITRFSEKNFGRAMSEYVVAQIVNYERDQRRQYENQRNTSWIADGKISDHRLISDLTVGILGLGTIGKFIGQILHTFGATVWGMTRTIPKDKLHYIDEHRTTEALSEILRTCDYVISVLPTTNETRGLLNGNVLKDCKDKSTVLINIGRGTIVKEEDLINALEQKWISAAILDVFEVEPLPSASKLWTMPQVTITPHCSGITRSQDFAAAFAENYDKYLKGEKIPNTLDINRGY